MHYLEILFVFGLFICSTNGKICGVLSSCRVNVLTDKISLTSVVSEYLVHLNAECT
jgi:hypothetical protein